MSLVSACAHKPHIIAHFSSVTLDQQHRVTAANAQFLNCSSSREGHGVRGFHTRQWIVSYKTRRDLDPSRTRLRDLKVGKMVVQT